MVNFLTNDRLNMTYIIQMSTNMQNINHIIKY